MTSFAHTGSTFKKVFAAWYMQNLVLYSMPLIAHEYCQQYWAAVKLNFENFNDVICAYRMYFRKSSWSLIDAEMIPLFTGANCALILLTVAEISDIEIFNDVIRAYRK